MSLVCHDWRFPVRPLANSLLHNSRNISLLLVEFVADAARKHDRTSLLAEKEKRRMLFPVRRLRFFYRTSSLLFSVVLLEI